MSTFRLSLRALGHPLSLLAIGTLLLNDHWLKVHAPSALTGKLSDFAGLFFFPFLLAAMLAWPLRRSSSRRVMALALGLTAVWFAAIKTTPWANALTVTALEALLSVPVQIVLDPTDCAALVMLFPTWLLWVQLERAQTEPPGRRAYLALGLAALATIATSPCPQSQEIVRLAADGETVVAKMNWTDYYAQSMDGGMSWEYTSNVSETIADMFQSQVVYPGIACVSDNAQYCYRLPDASRVEESTDGGDTWHTVWQIPWGRLGFLKRLSQTPASCIPEPIVSFSDLVLVGTSDSYHVIAAMGNQGVVVRNSTGEWERHAVLEAKPSPWSTMDAWGLFLNTIPEFSLLLLISLAVWLGQSMSVWTLVSAGMDKGQSASALGWILIILLAIGGVAYVMNIVQAISQSSPFVVAAISLPIYYVVVLLLVWPPSWLILLGLLLLLGWGWGYVIKSAPNPNAASQAAKQITTLTIGVLFAGWLPFVLWAAGIIPLYEIAAALAIALVVILLVRTWPKIMRLRREALIPPAV